MASRSPYRSRHFEDATTPSISVRLGRVGAQERQHVLLAQPADCSGPPPPPAIDVGEQRHQHGQGGDLGQGDFLPEAQVGELVLEDGLGADATAAATRGLAATSARSRQSSEPTRRSPSGRDARGLSTIAARRRGSSDQGGVEAMSSSAAQGDGAPEHGETRRTRSAP